MIRIALISDIHFGRLSRTAEFSVPGEPIIDENTGGESLKLSMISVFRDEKVDYLCIAGDLTSMGSPQEFCFCVQTILEVAKEVGIPEDRIILGLGNHDIDWNISELYNTYDTSKVGFPLEIVKKKYRRIAASAAVVNLDSVAEPKKCGPAPYSGIIENNDFVMFILNSGWCCTRDQAFSRGKLDTEQLIWFKQEAAKFRQDSRWKIILMHHHPFSYSYPIPSVDISMLEEGGEFLDVAGENGFNLVLHGHRHHPKAETNQKSGWNHPISFVCAGSLAVNASHRSGGAIPNTLHIIELTDEVGIIKLLNYQYSPAQGWIPISRNCPETPLDNMMMFGKLFDDEEINQSVLKLANKECVLKWDDLDDSLRFLPYDRLNEQVRRNLANTHRVIGLFPSEVVLIEK